MNGPSILRKTRILQLLASAQLGGGEIVAIDLADSLRGEFEGMGVWTPAHGAACEEADKRGVPSTSVPYHRVLTAGSIHRVRAVLATFYALCKARPHLIHAHSPYAYRAISLFRKPLGFRSIAHIHIETDVPTLNWCFKTPPDVVVACAEFLVPAIRTALHAVRATKTKIVVSRNSVDTNRFVPGDRIRARQELGMESDSRIILMLANLSPHKGQSTLIQAIQRLRGQGLPVKAYLAGVDRDQTGYDTALERLARDLGVADSVHFLGFRKDTERLLQAADFFALPSEHEGLPLSILEAQAAMVPVLSAPTAGIPEVVQHGSTGYLISAADSDGYARTIAKLLQSPSEAREVAERAYKKVQAEHSWQAYTRSIANLYRSLLGEKHSTVISI